MRKLALFFLLCLYCQKLISQSIYSALQHNVENHYKTKRPKSILGTNIFYLSSGKKVEKYTKLFDEAGMIITEERINSEGILDARLTYINDTVHRIIESRVFERWTRFGYTKETAFYSYDKNFNLISITDKDENGNVIRQTSMRCNERGHPLELSIFDSKGKLIGKEVATYLYDRNKAITSVISNAGVVLNSDTITISFAQASKIPDNNRVYNIYGDVTNWTSRNFNGTETIYEEEYTYDSFGNCTENRIFKVTVKGNGKRKRENDRIFKKEYTY